MHLTVFFLFCFFFPLTPPHVQSSSYDPWQWSGFFLLLSQCLCTYPTKWNSNRKIPLAAISKSSPRQPLCPDNALGQIWAQEHQGCSSEGVDVQRWRQTSDAGHTQVDKYWPTLKWVHGNSAMRNKTPLIFQKLLCCVMNAHPLCKDQSC